jgi:hypothetical protein
MESTPKYTRSVEIDGSPLRSLVEGEKGTFTALDATAKAIKTFTKRSDDVEASIHKSQYQNMVLEHAARAYHDHPNDIEGYRNALRESLKDYPIPPNQRHEYAAILYNGEARYFLPITSGEVTAMREEENDALLALADSYFRDGIGTMEGNLPPAAGGELGSEISGDGYVNAVDLAASAAGNGDPRGMERVNDYTMGVLDAHVCRDMGTMDDPTAGVEQYASGKRDVSTSVPTSWGTVEVTSASLPEEYRAQLRDNIYEGARKMVRTRSEKEHLSSGIGLVKFPATYRGTSDDKRALDVFGNVQLAMHPLSPDNINTHLRNMETFAKKFKYVPDGYVGEISARVNGMKDGYGAAVWSDILHTAMENGGEGIASQFSKDTLIRAYLIHDLTYEEGMDPGEALKMVNGLQHDPKRWEYTKSKYDELVKGSKNASDRAETYGTAVTPEKYGEKGVAEYEKLVRSFLMTNGYNISNAQNVAKKCLDAVYGTTRLGHYGKGWFGKRKVKYPPEAYYPSSVVRTVIAPHLRDVVIPSIRDNMGYPDLSNDNYVLVANDSTARAFYNKGEDAPPPAWEIWYVAPHGGTIPVFDGNGEVVTYSVDDATVEKIMEKYAIISQAIKASTYDLDDSITQEVWESAMDDIRRLEGGSDGE